MGVGKLDCSRTQYNWEVGAQEMLLKGQALIRDPVPLEIREEGSSLTCGLSLLPPRARSLYRVEMRRGGRRWERQACTAAARYLPPCGAAALT